MKILIKRNRYTKLIWKWYWKIHLNYLVIVKESSKLRVHVHSNVLDTSRKGRRYRNAAKALKRPWLQRVKDASMHFAAQIALSRLARPHTGAPSRTARAPQCTAAIESLCRYYCLSLQLARDRRPTLSVDCRRCWLPVHLHPRRDLCTRLVAPLHRWTAESIISHWMWFPAVYDKTTRLSFRPVIGMCLAFSLWAH